MVLTQLTATALQNKEGLAFGNQVLGWLILGNHLTTTNRSGLADRPISAHLVTKTPLPSPSSHYFPRLCTSLYYPHDIVRGTFLRHVFHYPRSME
jgi:hypothetical protein